MVDPGAKPFKDLLRGYRLGADLSQEALAERARLSIRTISDLERGVKHWPRTETVRLLAEALNLTPSDRALLEAAARRPSRPRVPADLPPERETPSSAPTAPAGNLPMPLTSFIGREREQAGVRSLLATHRLVTIVGAGGAGKTRLALCVADALVGSYRQGVRLVEFAALGDASMVPRALASVLGLREEPDQSLADTLTAQLKSSHMLLVLDNCEHLIAACADLVALLLRGCPQLHVLATSREGLRMPGETIYRVPSLTLPDAGGPLTPEDLLTFEAIQLFVERARERRADFSLTTDNADAVLQICRRLDGIPLALELAAVRIGVLTASDIAARLDDRFRLLTGGPRTVLPRQQTLRATLDWSYDLLGPQEHALLRRITVFIGGATLAAAEALCAGDLTSPLFFADTPTAAGDLAPSPAADSLVPPPVQSALPAPVAPGQGQDSTVVAKEEVLDLLDELVHKSLVLVQDAGRHVRYRLLETVRQYGLERLEASGETSAMRDRHLAWYLNVAIQAEHGLAGPEQGTWLILLERELDNLRAALAWSLGRPERTAAGLELAARLLLFWEGRGHATEARRRLEELLARGTAAPPMIRAMALHCAGALAGGQGDYAHAAHLLEESLILQRTLADQRAIAMTLQALGFVALNQGANHWAVTLYEESLALRRAISDPWGIAAALGNLGQAAYLEGEYDQATMFHEESLALRRELGNQRGIAVSLSDLGLVAWSRHDYDRAAALHEESLALRRDLGDMGGVATSLANRAEVAIAQEEYGRAGELLGESITLAEEIGDQQAIASCLENLAIVAEATGAPRHAATVFGAAEALRERLGAPLPSPAQAEYNRTVAALRTGLGEDIFATFRSQGRALPLHQALALAVAGADGATGTGGSAEADTPLP